MMTESLKKKFFSFIALTLLMTSMGLSAREINLLEIISEPEGNKVHLLTLGLDSEGDIVKINRKSQASVQSFSVNDLNESGVVLYRTEGRDVFKLSSRSLDRTMGGDVLLTYLTDGITNRYLDLELNLRRDGDTWYLEDERGNRIRKAVLKSRKFFGKIIGIKEIIIK